MLVVMKMKHVEGKKKGNVSLYALSTCGWCSKTKKLLDELGVDYSFVDVDLLGGEDRKEAMKEVGRWNRSMSFPTLVVNDKCIVGFDEDKIRKALGS